MTILLQWLVEYAWAFYAVCAVGVIFHVVRALTAQRERSLALFTLERETATAQVIRAWTMVFVFVAIGAAIFISATFILPGLPLYTEAPLPTSTPSAGVELPTPGATPTPSPTFSAMVPTFTPAATDTPPPTLPPSEPADTPTPAPTDTPQAALSGEIHIRFGDFAELVGYSLPSADVTTAQPLPLTLYWQKLEGTSPMDYLVFTHLLSEDGRLIAQHDGAPANGTRPVTSWVSGEVITDPHPMTFYDTAYVGPATVAVGLYDPATGRVLTETGGDYVVLPITINIIPQ